jgi:hypothetical protein
MEDIRIKELSDIKSVTIHKVNREPVGEIPLDLLDSLSKDISDTDTLELTIPRYINATIGKNIIEYPIYKKVKEERHICINDREFYTIKKITENKKKNSKKIIAYSSEIKLAKNDIEVEDIGFCLMDKDEEKGIYSLDEYMYDQVGWRFGYIDEKVRYSFKEDGTKQEKLRWQESVKTNWHDYILKNVSESFECVPAFNTNTKTIDLYDIDGFGNEIKLALTYDGYLKDLEKDTSSDDLVTRLKLYGNSELTILDASPTGYKYVEDYSYFMNEEEMSLELINALNKYSEMVAKRTIEWKEQIKFKKDKMVILNAKKNENAFVISNMNSLESLIKIYKAEKDVLNEAKKKEEWKLERDKFVILKNEIDELEEEVNLIQENINQINILCKRETCTDDSGSLIFDANLLDELKEFVFYDTYSNDSILHPDDLITIGTRQLELMCKPTREWSVDSVNFMERLIDTGFRIHFKGVLGLGDIIALVDEDDTEELVYLVGFNRDFKSKKLSLTLSDKKLKTDNKRVIGDLLFTAKKTIKEINNNRYLWMNQKYDRINLDIEKGK